MIRLFFPRSPLRFVGGVFLLLLAWACSDSSDPTSTTNTDGTTDSGSGTETSVSTNVSSPAGVEQEGILFDYNYPDGAIFEYEAEVYRFIDQNITYQERDPDNPDDEDTLSDNEQSLQLAVEVDYNGWLRYHPNPGTEADTTNLLIISDMNEGDIAATLNDLPVSKEDADSLDFRDVPDINHLLTIDPQGNQVDSDDTTFDTRSEYLDMLIGYTEGPLGGAAASVFVIGESILARPLAPIFPDSAVTVGSVWEVEISDNGPSEPLNTTVRFEITQQIENLWVVEAVYRTPGFTYEASEDFANLAGLLADSPLALGPDEYTQEVVLSLDYGPVEHKVEYLVHSKQEVPIGGRAVSTGSVSVTHQGSDLSGLPLSTSTNSTFRQTVEFRRPPGTLEGLAPLPDRENISATARTPSDVDTGPFVPVCDRAEPVQAAIMVEVAIFAETEPEDCAAVTAEDLALIPALEINAAGLSEISAQDLVGMPRLAQLSLRNNQLSEIHPNLLSGLPELRWIYFSGNQIEQVPAELFAQNPKLLQVSLDGNRLTELDPGLFSGLSELKELFLSDNRLSTLPDALLTDNTKLEGLHLGGNRFKEISDESIAPVQYSLTTLDLSSNQFDDWSGIPFGGLTSIRLLNLAANNLSEIPAGVLESEVSLINLDLSRNRLSTISEGAFAGLVLLMRLDLSGNQLTELNPELFFGLTNLQWLDLSNNRVAEIPDLSFLPNLEEISTGGQRVP